MNPIEYKNYLMQLALRKKKYYKKFKQIIYKKFYLRKMMRDKLIKDDPNLYDKAFRRLKRRFYQTLDLYGARFRYFFGSYRRVKRSLYFKQLLAYNASDLKYLDRRNIDAGIMDVFSGFDKSSIFTSQYFLKTLISDVRMKDFTEELLGNYIDNAPEGWLHIPAVLRILTSQFIESNERRFVLLLDFEQFVQEYTGDDPSKTFDELFIKWGDRKHIDLSDFKASLDAGEDYIV